MDNYIINVNIPNNISPFRLTRKQILITPKTKYLTPRYIENIEYMGQIEQQCISIDSEEHLYITDNHIVTHNTYCALATALSLLDSSEKYEQIILCKSVVTLPEEEIGFLKGTMEEKMEPFMMSYTWNIDKIMGKNASKALFDSDKLTILPLAYIRGLSIDNSIVIIDEAQNLSDHVFKSIITRIGHNSKYIVLGDVEQVDKKKKDESCLHKILEIFSDVDYVGTVEFGRDDCERNKLIPLILEKLEKAGI